MKQFLTAKGVPFTSKDVTSDNSAFKEMQKLANGATTVPVILVGDEAVMGFDRTRLQKALGIQ